MWILAIVSGCAVAGTHTAIIYAGCPLGINGCNEFHHEEDKGFFLVEAVKTFLPEEVLYVTVAVLGASLCGQILHWVPKNLSFQLMGGGTIQSMVAVATGERIPLTAALMRVFVSCVYLGSGGTLGMEGPAIQVCTASTTFISWVVGMRAPSTLSLLGALGLASGFAASFNSPLAGVLFAMEKLQHVSPCVSQHIICIILVAATTSTAMIRILHGNHHLLEVNWSREIEQSVKGGSMNQVFGQHMWMLICVPIGGLCSLVGLCINYSINKLHLWLVRWRRFLPIWVALPLQALVAAVVGALVFRYTGMRGIWGIGAESLQHALNAAPTTPMFLVFATGKMFAMMLAVAVRAPGDVLEPILIIGGFVGGAVGSLAADVTRMLGNSTLAEQMLKPCLVFGMVGLFASCFRFPLTPVVIVLELVGIDTYVLVLPTVLTSFTAITISNRLFRPIFEDLMVADSIDLRRMSEACAMNSTAAKNHEERHPTGHTKDSTDSAHSSILSIQSSTMSLLVQRLESSVQDLAQFRGLARHKAPGCESHVMPSAVERDWERKRSTESMSSSAYTSWSWSSGDAVPSPSAESGESFGLGGDRGVSCGSSPNNLGGNERSGRVL